MGKPFVEARGEAGYAAEFLRWFSEEAVRVNGDTRVAPGGTNRMLVGHAPIGDLAADHAVELPGRDGDAQDRPRARRGLHRGPQARGGDAADGVADRRTSSREAGVPDGVVNVVVTDDPGRSCEAILADPRVRKLVLHRLHRGRPAPARRWPPRSVISTSMELGGNAPFLVLEDADLDVAVRGRDGGEDAQRRRGLHGREPLPRARVGRRGRSRPA